MQTQTTKVIKSKFIFYLVVSLAAVFRVGPKLAPHQRLLTRATHSTLASDQ